MSIPLVGAQVQVTHPQEHKQSTPAGNKPEEKKDLPLFGSMKMPWLNPEKRVVYMPKPEISKPPFLAELTKNNPFSGK